MHAFIFSGKRPKRDGRVVLRIVASWEKLRRRQSNQAVESVTSKLHH